MGKMDPENRSCKHYKKLNEKLKISKLQMVRFYNLSSMFLPLLMTETCKVK